MFERESYCINENIKKKKMCSVFGHSRDCWDLTRLHDMNGQTQTKPAPP